jgi:hypothetical protein
LWKEVLEMWFSTDWAYNSLKKHSAVFAPRTHCDRATGAFAKIAAGAFPQATQLWKCPCEVLGLQSKLPELLGQV